ncbi:undecaprenyl-diphosphate phosphatase [Bacteroidaceae bacterium HV4-6-C5C]|jgi:undecaprenyl-diphosphatase UppP|nr:undecaprenyl-diphosphate phosphatase [Bacteroidaceae bacterium HV4-6-C5C]
MGGDLTVLQTIIIAIVEGLTEFLPVSSTGHMIIAQSILGVQSTEFVKAFTVIIQFGAILSVVWLYWKRFFRLQPIKIFDPAATDGKDFTTSCCIILKRFLRKYDFYWKLLVAFIPAALIGFLFSDKIDEMLESVEVVAIMLVIGGVFMLFCDKIFNKGNESLEITEKKAFNIGLFQCIAMIPGVSRSMATIVGGMAQKMTRKDAAEFSFFLAVPTMFAATAYKVLKLLMHGGKEVLMANMPTLILGNIVAFIVALLAIKFFISFVTKYGFKAFGWYRIIVGVIILLLLITGHNLEVG